MKSIVIFLVGLWIGAILFTPYKAEAQKTTGKLYQDQAVSSADIGYLIMGVAHTNPLWTPVGSDGDAVAIAVDRYGRVYCHQDEEK